VSGSLFKNILSPHFSIVKLLLEALHSVELALYVCETFWT